MSSQTSELSNVLANLLIFGSALVAEASALITKPGSGLGSQSNVWRLLAPPRRGPRMIFGECFSFFAIF